MRDSCVVTVLGLVGLALVLMYGVGLALAR